MAKKRVTPGGSQPALDSSWQEEYPEVVTEAADSYLRAMRQKNKITETARNAREKCVELMRENGITKMRIDEGKQWLELEDDYKLKTRKVNVEKDDTRQSAKA
jgi:uncharacterized membrane protein